jgi:hypothetical protein
MLETPHIGGVAVVAAETITQNRLKALAGAPSHISDARVDALPSFSRHDEPTDTSEQKT